MKKNFIIFTIIAYLFTSVTAFADNYSELFNLRNTVKNRGSISIDVKLESLNELQFLDELPDFFAPYNTKSVIESILKSKIHLDTTYSMQFNRQKITSYTEAYTQTPLKLNDDLKIDADAVFKIWTSMNFTSENNPYYYIIINSPIDEKYYILDSTAEDSVKIYPSKSHREKLYGAIDDVLRQNSNLVQKNSFYELSMSDSNFKNALDILVNNYFGRLFSYFVGTEKTIDYSSFKSEYTSAVKRLKTINLLGKNGIKITTGKEENKISTKKFVIDIDSNIFKLYYAATGNEMPVDPNATKPIINVNNSDIHLIITIDVRFLSSSVSFRTPTPPSDQTVDIFRDKSGYSLSYTISKNYVSPYETISIKFPGFTVYQNGTAYIPLRIVLNSIGIPDENIVWNDDKIEIYGNENVLFNKTYIANDYEIYKDEELITLNKGIIQIDNTTYIPEEFVNNILFGNIIDYNTSYYPSYNMYITTARFERIKPAYYEEIKNQSLGISIK